MSADTKSPRAIEVGFPIVEINRLSVPERNSFKPVYQMHKWFARRASCVFRAILLGALKPAVKPDGTPTDIMEEFYKDHSKDPDTKGVAVLDPFMGGGTTIVEALRLGCNVTGIDLNPVAWFIVKTETEPVDMDALRQAFDRLADRPTSSGRPLRDELLSYYKTTCPCCGSQDADTVYTFWVRSGVCTKHDCHREVPLHRGYLVAQRTPSIRYWRDAECPKCRRTFDWEIEPAAIVGEEPLRKSAPGASAGVGRGNARWAFSSADEVQCPWCQGKVRARPTSARSDRKKVLLSVLLCPHCEAVWQWRGDLPEAVDCPACGHAYQPSKGNLPDNNDFVCSCGTRSGILDSLRQQPPDTRRRLRAYAIAGYCSVCGGGTDEDEEGAQPDMFKHEKAAVEVPPRSNGHACVLTRSKGRFFRRITAEDAARFQSAAAKWEEAKSSLPHPQQEIPHGYQTVVGNDLPGHGFARWQDLFNSRQLLALSTLLKAINQEVDFPLREMLLSAFFQALRSNCLLCIYELPYDKLVPALSRKDFAPPKSPLENSVWGSRFGRGTFVSVIDRIIAGKQFCVEPSDRRFLGLNDSGAALLEDVPSQEQIAGTSANSQLLAQSSSSLDTMEFAVKFDVVITDPPYADNVNYSEVADFFYVWMRLSLSEKYPWFLPEFTPKADEIIAQATRGRSMADFQSGLTRVFSLCADRLKENGLLVFTFHHEANEAWEAVLQSLMDAGYAVEAVYPYESEAMKKGSMGAQKIAYDLIHVCKKRQPSDNTSPRSWAGLRQEIRRRAKGEVAAIEKGRYGNAPLAAADVTIVLTGKCLELYSAHYGTVVDHEGNPFLLHQALQDIGAIVDQLVTQERRLPSELEDIDGITYIWLLLLLDKRTEISGDELSKALRTKQVTSEDLRASGLIIKGRAGRGRSFKVKQPQDRLEELKERLGADPGGPEKQVSLFAGEELRPVAHEVPLVDVVHLLIGLSWAGESVVSWLDRFSYLKPHVRAALRHARDLRIDWKDPIDRVLNIIDGAPLFDHASRVAAPPTASSGNDPKGTRK